MNVRFCWCSELFSFFPLRTALFGGVGRMVGVGRRMQLRVGGVGGGGGRTFVRGGGGFSSVSARGSGAGVWRVVPERWWWEGGAGGCRGGG